MISFEKYLSPLFKRVNEILDFSNLRIDNDLEKEEYPYLQRISALLGDDVESRYKIFKSLEVEIEVTAKRIENETGDSKKEAVMLYNALIKSISEILHRINKDLSTLDSPYFGKIVIDRKASKNVPQRTFQTYIGKSAYFDTDTKELLVSDWRAPISNVYYTNSGPTKDISYNSPLGLLKGDLKQKRQFEIYEARISHIYDAKSGNVSADEFLLAQLKKRLGKKLKEIVATIQSQQNEIIREKLNKFIILQGVAGSGKTTIVLHRLAYLFFTYPDKITPEKTLVVAPNRMFLDYISDVLPSLGVTGVETNTYLFWAKKILGWGDHHILSAEKPDLSVKKEKGGISFIEKLSEFFEKFEEEMLYSIPYSGSDVVIARYNEIKEKFPSICLSERLNLALERAFNSKSMKKSIADKYISFTDLSETIRNKVNKYIREKTNVLSIYKAFVNSTYVSLELRRFTKSTLKKNGSNYNFMIEDLAPLVWIYQKIYGTSEFTKEYIVVDEAQDMSPFEIFTLYKTAKRGNLFLAGDLAQSVIPPFYIKSWNEIVDFIVKSEKLKEYSYFQLNRCYRSTVEIIEFANGIFKKYFPKNYVLPEAVLRHGESVETIKFSNSFDNLTKSDLETLTNVVNTQFENEYATVALICKSEDVARKAYDFLKGKEKLFSRNVYTYDDNDYRTGILVLPISKAKGLEFDCAIIANSNDYTEEELDIRMFYVAVTRPLHKLYIAINGENKGKIIS